MDLDPLFPGMVDTVGALLPALISLGIVLARQARTGLGAGDQFWVVAVSLALTALLCRATVTAEATSLHVITGSTPVLCYLIWRGHYVSPGLAFAVTYATCLAVDVFMGRMLIGPAFNSECIGGAGWRDGLVLLPAMTALAVGYANWRMAQVGRPGLVWFETRAGGRRGYGYRIV